MERVVSAEEMKWCDETTINKIGIPGIVLMEHAGAAIARHILQTLRPVESKHIVVVCGKGNNGGDGFVVARHLAGKGAAITVLMLSPASQLTKDALAEYQLLKHASGPGSTQISIQRFSSGLTMKLRSFDAIVDAIFGTGFTGKAKPPYSHAIEWINGQNVTVFAVDIPSGLNATNGIVEHVAVRAHSTITFGMKKLGIVLNQGKEFCGTVEVADIGIPAKVIESKALSETYLVDENDIRVSLPKRPSTAHKYSVGKVLVIAGSKGLTGAAAMCATSCLRAGCGAVVLATPDAVYPILSRKLTEVMVTPLPSTDDGSASEAGFDILRTKFDWADVIAIGPGLSQHPETQRLVLNVLREYHGRVLLDADGLNALAIAGVDALRHLKGEIILTPHTGEFARLIGRDSQGIDRERIELSRGFAKQFRQTLVLKGAPTVTATRSGRIYINSTGNPGMATAGSGDVLSGIIAGLWAQGMAVESAAMAGVYLHGLAGDLSARAYGERSMLAGDMIAQLPKALLHVEQKVTR
jgi:NAD(P)H-hydrate epimerase